MDRFSCALMLITASLLSLFPFSGIVCAQTPNPGHSGADIAAGTIGGTQIQDGSITGTDIQDATIGIAKMQLNTITMPYIADNLALDDTLTINLKGYDLDIIPGAGRHSLVITGSGNVGIGTSSPSYALEVNGSVRSTTGGFIFPDGSFQKTAAVMPAPYIPPVNVWIPANVGSSWVMRGAMGTGFSGVAMSSDGKHQIAVKYAEYIYESSNYGVNWVRSSSISNIRFIDAAISSDGTYKSLAVVTASGVTGSIMTSSDGGATWTMSSAPRADYRGIAMSSDGRYQVGTPLSNYLQTSSDYGKTWTPATSAGAWEWYSAALSSDGRYQAAVGWSGYIYVSSNYGITWTQTSAGGRVWADISMSADGRYMTAVVYNGYIYTSSDYGATWTARTGPGALNWQEVAVSGDGRYQLAGSDLHPLYFSSDYGATWASVAAPGSMDWRGLAISMDGRYMTAVDYDAGYIYVSSTNDSYISGSVGIGKVPASTLDVSGTIRAQNICDESGANCKDVSAGWSSSPWTVSGSDVYRPSGRAGIGISPTYALDVSSATSNTYPARVASPEGYLLFGPANNGWSHFSTDRPGFYFNTGVTVDTGNIGSYNEDLSLRTSGTTRMTISNSNGYVGIGTGAATPKQMLHVADGIYARGHVYLYAYEGDGASGTAYMQARDDSGTSSISMVLRTQNAGTVVNALTLSSTGAASIGGSLTVTGATSLGSLTATGNTNLDSGTLYVDASNNRIGIGTTAPGDLVDIRVGGTSNKFVFRGENNVGFEMRSETSGGTPYIDFANDASSDYDARIILSGNDVLGVAGANFVVGSNVWASSYCDVNGANCTAVRGARIIRLNTNVYGALGPLIPNIGDTILISGRYTDGGTVCEIYAARRNSASSIVLERGCGVIVSSPMQFTSGATFGGTWGADDALLVY